MKRRQRLLCLLCAVMLICGGLSFFLGSGQEVFDMVQGWIGRHRYAYTGTMTVWHIPGRAMGRGDGSAFLKNRIEVFERKNFGIYFDYQVLTQEEALQKLQAGETPDIISYPESFDLAMACATLSIDTKGLDAGLFAAAGATAVPYYVGGCVLLYHDEALYALPDLLPPGDGLDGDWIEQALSVEGFSLLRIGEQVTPGVLAAAQDARLTSALALAPVGTWQDLTDGAAQIAVADLSTLYALLQRAKTQLLPGIRVVPFSYAGTQVQYLSVRAGLDPDCAQAATGFLSYLLSKSVQSDLLDNFAFPVRQDLADILPDDTTMAFLWEMRRGEKIRCIARSRAPKLLPETLRLLEDGCDERLIQEWRSNYIQ